MNNAKLQRFIPEYNDFINYFKETISINGSIPNNEKHIIKKYNFSIKYNEFTKFYDIFNKSKPICKLT